MKQHSYKLIGLDTKGSPAKFAIDVDTFRSESGLTIKHHDSKSCTLVTRKGVYELPFKNGRYEGVCGKYKVHVCLKKIVGTVHTWF